MISNKSSEVSEGSFYQCEGLLIVSRMTEGSTRSTNYTLSCTVTWTPVTIWLSEPCHGQFKFCVSISWFKKRTLQFLFNCHLLLTTIIIYNHTVEIHKEDCFYCKEYVIHLQSNILPTWTMYLNNVNTQVKTDICNCTMKQLWI